MLSTSDSRQHVSAPAGVTQAKRERAVRRGTAVGYVVLMAVVLGCYVAGVFPSDMAVNGFGILATALPIPLFARGIWEVGGTTSGFVSVLLGITLQQEPSWGDHARVTLVVGTAVLGIAMLSFGAAAKRLGPEWSNSGGRNVRLRELRWYEVFGPAMLVVWATVILTLAAGFAEA